VGPRGGGATATVGLAEVHRRHLVKQTGDLRAGPHNERLKFWRGRPNPATLLKKSPSAIKALRNKPPSGVRRGAADISHVGTLNQT
jgi:hypothetical protein